MKLVKTTKGRSRWYDDACGTALALEFVGERWSLLIMRELMFGPRRFSEIRAELPGISANVLTQRLEGLEAAGIVEKRRLLAPAVMGYDLTDWGREAEPIFQEMGRWATRSARHDPTLPFSAASAMLSLRTMIDRAKAGDWHATLAFRFPRDAFLANLIGGELAIRRGEGDAQVTLATDPSTLAALIYGKLPLDGLVAGGAVSVSGNPAVFERFAALFQLPAKIA